MHSIGKSLLESVAFPRIEKGDSQSLKIAYVARGDRKTKLKGSCGNHSVWGTKRPSRHLYACELDTGTQCGVVRAVSDAGGVSATGTWLR